MLSLSVFTLLPFLTATLAQGYGNGKTSTTSTSSPSTTTAAAAGVHTVLVGKGGLVFTPSTIKAAKGDQIEFVFESAGHSVAAGSFKDACQPSGASAFYSSFVTPGGQPFTITVNTTDPMPFYCTQVGHCQAGMVGMINPSSTETEEKYLSAAKASKKSTSPAQVQGGVFAAAKSGGSSGSSSSAGSSGTTSSSAAASTPTTGSATRSAMMGIAALAGVALPVAWVSFGAV